MKKLLYLLITLMMLFLYTCSQDESLVPDPAADADLKSTPSCGAVIKVRPSGGNDTQALIDAFEKAKETGPGTTVLLTKGVFTIGFIEIRDFNGYFKGSGKSVTKITNQEELPCGEAYDNNVLASLVKFIGGKVRISDMTFQIKDGRPCAFSESNELNMGDLFSILIMADYTDNYVPENRTMKAMIENVDFIGGVDDGYGIWGTTHNTGIGVWCGPDFWWPLWDEPFGNGEYIISGCNFTFFLDGVEGFGLGHEAVMKVSNNHFDKSLMQLYFSANMGCKVFVQNNWFKEGIWTDITMEDVYMDWVFPTVIPDYRTEYYVSGNVFNSPEGVISLRIHDAMRIQTLNDDFAMQFNVKNNIFKTRANGTAILSENNMDAKIGYNKFLGTGSIGVMVNGSEGAFASNIGIINNNFQSAGFTGADVYLGPYTRDCRVAGMAGDVVIDEGENNTVTGITALKSSSVNEGKSYQLKSLHEQIMRIRKP